MSILGSQQILSMTLKNRVHQTFEIPERVANSKIIIILIDNTTTSLGFL